VSTFWQWVSTHIVDQGPWAFVVFYAVHRTSQLWETWMVQTAPYDMFITTRWRTIRRGTAGDEPAGKPKPRPRQALRSVENPDPNQGRSAHSG
jgi:hypothetical protein